MIKGNTCFLFGPISRLANIKVRYSFFLVNRRYSFLKDLKTTTFSLDFYKEALLCIDSHVRTSGSNAEAQLRARNTKSRWKKPSAEAAQASVVFTSAVVVNRSAGSYTSVLLLKGKAAKQYYQKSSESACKKSPIYLLTVLECFDNCAC